MAYGVVPFDQLEGADLVVGYVYLGGKQGHAADDPLSKLLPCGNMGGFRQIGKSAVVLYSSSEEPDWPDAVDDSGSTFVYYGDQRTAGKDLLDTPRGGNKLLLSAFNDAAGDRESRQQVPIFLVFTKAHDFPSRSVTFRGLAVPELDGLTVETQHDVDNYRASFAILNIPRVERGWISDVVAGNPDSDQAPPAWVRWRDDGTRQPLTRDASAGVVMNQERFHRRHPEDLKIGSKKFAKFNAEVLGRDDLLVVHYVTITAASRQLGNKLAQAAKKKLPVGAEMLLLLSLEDHAYDEGVTAVVDGWEKNGWDTTPSCVGLVRRGRRGWRIDDIVQCRPSVVPDLIQERLFPRVEVHRAAGFMFDESEPNHPLRNLILYGPPGTGKTYVTIERAVAICRGHAPQDHATAVEEWRSLQAEKRVEFVTFHPSYSYEDFVEGLFPHVDKKTGQLVYDIREGVLRRLADRARQRPDQPHVLVIDEINRGNIAKVLGELITLLEPSKRLGAEDERSVTLPYRDGEKFGLPSNLFVIGTMNTADRSIAFVDLALRRRFEFEEMAPDTDLLRDRMPGSGIVSGVDVPTLVDSINERVEFLLDRDHRIGHAYFIKVKNLDDLRKAFLSKVVPLLVEYFHGDWQRVAMVLGCGWNDDGAQSAPNPIIKATLKKASEMFGKGTELENQVFASVSPQFRDANEGDLASFFKGITGQSA